MVDSTKRWKYVSIGLMAILAVGFSFPQSFAHLTNNLNHVIEDIFNNTEEINDKVDALTANTDRLYRIEAQLDDGADDLYTGDVRISRVDGTSAFRIEQLYLCDMSTGSSPDPGLFITYSLQEGNVQFSPALPANDDYTFYVTPGEHQCLNILVVNRGGAFSEESEMVSFQLAGDENHYVQLAMTENDIPLIEDDPGGATLVAIISGISSATDIEITSTTADT